VKKAYKLGRTRGAFIKGAYHPGKSGQDGGGGQKRSKEGVGVDEQGWEGGTFKTKKKKVPSGSGGPPESLVGLQSGNV